MDISHQYFAIWPWCRWVEKKIIPLGLDPFNHGLLIGSGVFSEKHSNSTIPHFFFLSWSSQTFAFEYDKWFDTSNTDVPQDLAYRSCNKHLWSLGAHTLCHHPIWTVGVSGPYWQGHISRTSQLDGRDLNTDEILSTSWSYLSTCVFLRSAIQYRLQNLLNQRSECLKFAGG